MTPARRPSVAPAQEPQNVVRAKALRPFEVQAETRSALFAYERAARDYESMAHGGHDAVTDTRSLRRAAFVLCAALATEHDEGGLPRALEADVSRWLDGEFAGTDVDVELANHALHALLGSDACAELPHPI